MAITLYSFPCKHKAKIVSKPVVKHRNLPNGQRVGILCGKTKKCGKVCGIISNEKIKK